MSVRISIRSLFLCAIVTMIMASPAASQQAATVGQISGVASIPGKGTLAGVTAQLRDLATKQLVAVVKTNASGQFVLIVDHPGTFIVEILDEKGNVVGTTAPIVLSRGAMIVSGVAVSPSAPGAAAGVGGVAGSPEQGQAPESGQGLTTAAGAMAGGGVSSNIFMPSLPSVSSAATGSGVAAGTVPSRGTASPSQ